MGDVSNAVVLGASGAAGNVIARELADRGARVRVVSRSRANLSRWYDGGAFDIHPADVTDPDACRRACEGSELIFECIGQPLAQFERHIAIARNVAHAAQSVGARCALVTGYWSAAPSDGPIDPTTPLTASNPKSSVRIDQERILQDVGAVVLVLPDFFGPRVGASVLNDALAALIRRKRVLWPGRPEALRDFIYMPDLARPCVELALRAEARGKRWVIGGSGAEAPAALLARSAEIAGVPLRLKRITPLMVKLASIFSPDIRQFAQVHPIYDAPATFDDSATRELIGDWPRTPYDEALPETIRWLRAEA